MEKTSKAHFYILIFILCTLAFETVISMKDTEPVTQLSTRLQCHNYHLRKIPSENLTFPEINSPKYLIELAKYEMSLEIALLDLVRNHSNLVNAELIAKIKEYLNKYAEEKLSSKAFASQNSRDDWAYIVGNNPILTLNMIWRFANDLRLIWNIIQAEVLLSKVDDGPAKDFIKDIKAVEKWPTKLTVANVMNSFLRLQVVYSLNVTEVSTGYIFGVETGSKLSVAMMYALGNYARKAKMYILAVPWLEYTMSKLHLMLMTKSSPVKINIKEVEDGLMETMMEHDLEFPHRSTRKSRYFFIDKLLHQNQTVIQRRRQVVQQLEWSICSGNNHQTEEQKRKLNCWYDRSTNPALYISPVKKEILSDSPYVVQMYDVMGEEAMKSLLFKANPDQLSRSSKLSDGNVKYEPEAETQYSQTNLRSSVGSFLHIPLPKLSKFIEASTGLSVVQDRALQPLFVTSYAVGGHFDCHMDTFAPEDVRHGGNRMVTMIFYLEEPQIGGRTAFPKAGTSAKPVKGSAIYWYNLKSNGEVNEVAYHCGCPVVLGHKTVATKWILHDAQFRQRPCELRMTE